MEQTPVRRAAILLGAGGTHNLAERQRVRALAQALDARARQGHAGSDTPGGPDDSGSSGDLGDAVVAAFVTAGKSDRDFTLADAIAYLAARGATDLVIVPYLLEWHYPEQYDVHDQLQDLAQDYPQVRLRLARALGGAPELQDLLAERLAAAWSNPDAASASVRQVAEVADQSPVTKATLDLAAGALPHLPVHVQHVLLCTGRRCMEQGSDETYRALMAALAARGLSEGPQRVKVTRTKCLSPCQAAPVACIYPGGAFYAQVTPVVAPQLVEQVLVKGEDLPGRSFRAGT